MDSNGSGSITLDNSTLRRILVEDFIALVRETNEILEQESDLSPANRRVADNVRRLTQRLRNRFMPEDIQAVLGNEYMKTNQRHLREKLSVAEFLTELDDAKQICERPDPVLNIVTEWPSWRIYLSLVCKELFALQQFKRHGADGAASPIVFVGSGPLPLSAIILHQFGHVEVVCLEMDMDAYATSCRLLQRMGLQDTVKVVHINGAEFDYSAYDRIFIASLVRNKLAVLHQICRTSHNPLVAVRTAEGMKQIMYEAIDESELLQHGWSVQARTSPDEDLVINSTLFLERAT
ncbi:nicotianamine synthase family protein [Paenibacillus sp. strain BS8-2]